MKNIKPISELSDIEKSALHAVKALIFMKYPSLSKRIAFEEAEKALKLNSTEPEWMHIWLLAKGPFNREYNNFAKPDVNETKVAEDLYNLSQTYWHLMSVGNVFIKLSKRTTIKEHDKYFELASQCMS